MMYYTKKQSYFKAFLVVFFEKMQQFPKDIEGRQLGPQTSKWQPALGHLIFPNSASEIWKRISQKCADDEQKLKKTRFFYFEKKDTL